MRGSKPAGFGKRMFMWEGYTTRTQVNRAGLAMCG